MQKVCFAYVFSLRRPWPNSLGLYYILKCNPTLNWNTTLFLNFYSNLPGSVLKVWYYYFRIVTLLTMMQVFLSLIFIRFSVVNTSRILSCSCVGLCSCNHTCWVRSLKVSGLILSTGGQGWGKLWGWMPAADLGHLCTLMTENKV